VRNLGLVVALVAVLLAAAACGGNGSGSSLGGSVNFMAFGDPEELQAYRNIISSFRDRQPDISVKLIEASDREDLLARLATGFAGGKPPDVFLINYRFFGQFAARGVLDPLGPHVEHAREFSLEDFYAPAVAAFRFAGRLMCMPQNISSLVVYYNKDLFRKAGVPEPKDGWTWKQFTDAAGKLTKDVDGDGKIDQYGLGVEPVLIRLAPFVWSNGAELVKPDLSGFALDTPAAREVLEEFFGLHANYRVTPSEQEVESENDETRFMNGRLAMILDSRRSTPTFRTITKFDWDVGPLPIFKKPATILHSDAYCMTKASNNKDATWAFIEFALSPEGQRIAAATGRTVPSLKKVAESDAFLDPGAKPARSKVFLDAIEHMRRVPSISTWPEIEDAAQPILEEAFFEGAPPGEIPAKLEPVTRGIFARGDH
jgi:multiple sugar transport system substrate-binding protein